MIWAKTLRRWTMQTIHAAILGSALFGAASVAAAQPSGITASKLPPINYTRSQTFNLPVVMDKNDRAQLSEIRLYVKTPSTAWTVQERGSSELTQFNCKVAQDGEYWYTLALVDRSGRQTPMDVNLEAPSQRVVVDTTAPVIQVQPHNSDGDFCLRCTMQDASPDYATLKAVCKTDTGDLPLETVPSQPGVFRVRSAELMRFPVVVSAKDMAGNTGSREVNVREMIASQLTAKSPPTIAPTSGSTEQKSVPPRIEPLPPPPLSTDVPKKTELTFPTPPTLTPAPPTLTPAPPSVLGSTSPQSAPHHLINATHASVEYRIDQVGPSGVGKVEIWMTPDKGQSWHRLMEHAAKRSPAEINLPGDGVFGIRVVVANGNGFGGKAPAKGDAPHYTIEVDTTAPFVQMRSADVLPSSGQVELKWNATDKNLGAEPVSLYYRTKADGPWQVIAKGIKNEGVHRWVFPRDAGSQFSFKVEVTDTAGNISQAASSQPIIIDMAEPRVTVVGVTGAAATPRP